MSHGLPNNTTGCSLTIQNSVVLLGITGQTTSHSATGLVNVFERGVRNRGSLRASLLIGHTDPQKSVYYGPEGVAIQNNCQLVTSANVSWAAITFRYWAG